MTNRWQHEPGRLLDIADGLELMTLRGSRERDLIAVLNTSGVHHTYRKMEPKHVI